MFVWTVEHPEHEKVKVEADTRLNAITTAARLWGVPWTSVARECRTEAVEKLDKPAPKRPASGTKKPETVAGKQPDARGTASGTLGGRMTSERNGMPAQPAGTCGPKKAKSQKGEHHGN